MRKLKEFLLHPLAVLVYFGIIVAVLTYAVESEVERDLHTIQPGIQKIENWFTKP